MTAWDLVELDSVFNRLEEIGRQFLALFQESLGLLSKLRMAINSPDQNPDDAPNALRSAIRGKPFKPKHIGQIVRRLRQAAHLSRAELAQQVHIADSTIRNIESARHRPTRRSLSKLRQHPAMARLWQLAREAGLVRARPSATDKTQEGK